MKSLSDILCQIACLAVCAVAGGFGLAVALGGVAAVVRALDASLQDADASVRAKYVPEATLKGRGVPIGTDCGGWGFHAWRVSDPETLMWRTVRFSAPYAGGLVATNAIPGCPVFNRGYSPMFDRDATQDEVFMALAKYVPAVSSAVGGQQLDRNVDENVDMNSVSEIDGVPRPNGWGRDSADDANPWQHSDMKDVAYYYVFGLYRQLNAKGGLK